MDESLNGDATPAGEHLQTGDRDCGQRAAEQDHAGKFGKRTRSPERTSGAAFPRRNGGLFRWAAKARLAKDPTFGLENPEQPKTEGFPPWTEDDVAAYERRWPIGTRQRVWLDVLLYTGLRRGDAVRLGRQHVRNCTATLITEKTGTTVALPILAVLQQTLDAGPCGDLAFVVGANGKPLKKESFGNMFAEAARAAGVKKSCHGLRKIAAIRCAENDATLPQMNAIFGWVGARMGLRYIEAANRKKLAAQAMEKLNIERTNFPAPEGEVRGREEKA
jgi:integrase